MSARIAFPFLTLQPGSVLVSEWKVAIGDEELTEAGDWLADWDASIPIRLSRSIGVDFEAAARDLELVTGKFELAASIRIGTGAGRLPRAIIARDRQRLTAENPVMMFETVLEGGDLSTVVDLHVDLILGDDCLAGGDLSPRRGGDRVWHDATRIRIEGEEPRLPIEIADLSTLLPGTAAQAPWYLQWSPRDWNRDFHGAIRLYLNSGHRALVARIEEEDPEILRALMADVMGQVCEALARDADAASIIETCNEGSLGSQAAEWLRAAFPGSDLSRIRSQVEQRPGLFRASIQALAEQQVDEE
ncbi:hypothetical protein [Sphingopyxis sp. 22461]|uniref:hypothetical protein n=1 Tax=Sphingopyxis sp. 22461 TaxID=3453923 RepID=UPI003F8491B6